MLRCQKKGPFRRVAEGSLLFELRPALSAVLSADGNARDASTEGQGLHRSHFSSILKSCPPTWIVPTLVKVSPSSLTVKSNELPTNDSGIPWPLTYSIISVYLSFSTL